MGVPINRRSRRSVWRKPEVCGVGPCREGSRRCGDAGRPAFLVLAFLLLVTSATFSIGSAPRAVFAQEQEEPEVAGDEATGEARGTTATAGSTAPESSGLAPGIVARVNGRDISVEEYASYLFATLGRSKLDQYVDRLLIEAWAQWTRHLTLDRDLGAKPLDPGLFGERMKRMPVVRDAPVPLQAL